MPLIRCPDCERQVSTLAESCPNCGRPMRAAPLSLGRDLPRVRTIQKTDKGLKAQVLLAVMFLLGGTIGIIVASQGEFAADSEAPGWLLLFSIFGVCLGMGWLIIAKILIWWHHG